LVKNLLETADKALAEPGYGRDLSKCTDKLPDHRKAPLRYGAKWKAQAKRRRTEVRYPGERLGRTTEGAQDESQRLGYSLAGLFPCTGIHVPGVRGNGPTLGAGLQEHAERVHRWHLPTETTVLVKGVILEGSRSANVAGVVPWW